MAIASSKRPAFWAVWPAERSCCTLLDGLEGRFAVLLEGNLDGSFDDELGVLFAGCCARACWPRETKRMLTNIRKEYRPCVSLFCCSPSYWLRPRQVLPRAITQTGSFSSVTLTSVPITALIDWTPVAGRSPARAQL